MTSRLFLVLSAINIIRLKKCMSTICVVTNIAAAAETFGIISKLNYCKCLIKNRANYAYIYTIGEAGEQSFIIYMNYV